MVMDMKNSLMIFAINWIINKTSILLLKYRKLNKCLLVFLLIIIRCYPIFADMNISNFEKYFRTISNDEKRRISLF